ncbi:MAG: glycerophosphodiester phosphodiesterase [Alphaproteobacteria bacterium]|nr:glycerophosphodiester phosphodiesterase [Alphaproteobacteria bacterium]
MRLDPFHALRRCAALLLLLLAVTPAAAQDGPAVQLGPRPYYLVERMAEGALKDRLAQCAAERTAFAPAAFSIGHRGAPLQFPEHTKDSYEAAARMGAGVIECDVTFTADKALVCRHAQCDLHRTTNILETPLAARCGRSTGRQDVCCASDITLAEFRTLEGRMDAKGPTPRWRTDLYATGGRPMTHAESIALLDRLGVGFTPELKAPAVTMPFDGLTREDFARRMIAEYKEAGIAPERVRPQSFSLDDILFWLRTEPVFGRRAVFLEGRDREIDPADPSDDRLDPNMRQLRALGVRAVAPPIWILLTTRNGRIVPSRYAEAAKRAGLEILSWTVERSGRIGAEVLRGDGGYYYRSIRAALRNDGDILTVIDVLAREVGIAGLFSDWPATTTFYANCMEIR